MNGEGKIYNINDILDYLENSAIKREKLGIEPLTEVLYNMGNPHKKLKVIHVAGTNGKGSTSAFISQILEEMGYKVGLYTSPYLELFNERIQINRKNISDDDLIESFNSVKKHIDYFISQGNKNLSEFEIITAVAYEYFNKEDVDFVVLEVGLGGEYDATNTCYPIISVITSISLDHTDFLGNDIKEIARTKAGIIKNNIPVVVYNQEDEILDVIKNVALENKSEFYVTNFNYEKKHNEAALQEFDCYILNEKIEGIKIKLNGEHQIKNFITALTTIKVLFIKNYIKEFDITKIKSASEKTFWNGRIEVLKTNPLIIIDGAHNLDGAISLCNYINENLDKNKILFVFGMLKDKEIEKVVEKFLEINNNFILVKPNNPRAEECENIKKIILNKDRNATINIVKTINESIDIAQELAKENNLTIVYAGSLYMIGAVRTSLNNKNK